MPGLADLQHWTWVLGRAQQQMMEAGLAAFVEPDVAAAAYPKPPAPGSASRAMAATGLALWQQMLDAGAAVLAQTTAPGVPTSVIDPADRRFRDPRWQAQPLFAWIASSYLQLSDALLTGVDTLPGLDGPARERLKFATRGWLDAMSPSNFPATNPIVVDRTIETGGENLLKGLRHMLRDIARGQLTHSDDAAFEIGRNLAITPGKVVVRTALYEVIQYSPTTPTVLATPLVIFPPWINRFYILDLTPEKSFVAWAVGQGLTVIMVSWKSADASMREIVWDDYVAAQIDVIDLVRGALDVPSVHAIGYCVAGTTLAATLAVLAARGKSGGAGADKVATATFFTAQVDFAEAGELRNFVDDDQLEMIARLSPDGFLDGRYMALTFNLLRGRDLIWNYVTANYLLGDDYLPFDLLHWNSDTTNLPAKWHASYLTDLYRDNRLVEPGALSVGGTPIDLSRVATPAYIQAGRDDHIAPAASVWAMMDQFSGPRRFVLAGSGHIAGVINPPAAGKYQYWTNDAAADSLADFVAGAHETGGSWWPDWIGWLRGQGADEVVADGPRIPGAGALPALDEAPGRYVRLR